jgi:hypothetical protein
MLPTSSWGLRRRRYGFRKTGNSSDQSCTYDTRPFMNSAAGQFSFKSAIPRALNSTSESLGPRSYDTSFPQHLLALTV